MPIKKTLAYAALVKGIFKTPSEFDFPSVTASDMEKAKSALIRDGLEAVIYGWRAKDIYEKMLSCAKRNLPKEGEAYLTEWEL